MLTARNIRKHYNGLPVLNGVNLDVARGELLSITGASGAGKTTFLNILGTLDQPDNGEIIMNGMNVCSLKGSSLSNFRNKHIGFIFQFHHLLPEFNALENVCIPAWIAGVSKKEAIRHATALLSELGLANRMSHKPAALSGGEQQRVAIARALINQPEVVLADEPTGNLDSQNALQLMQIIHRLREKFKQTFILVTHNEELAAQTDRVLHMTDGRFL